MQEEYNKLMDAYRQECEYAGALKHIIKQTIEALRANITGQIALSNRVIESFENANNEYSGK